MKDINKDEELSRLFNTLKASDLEQLDTDINSWDEFQKLVSIKCNIQSLFDQKSEYQDKSEIFLSYDNAYSLFVAKASDYFYERGFADCLHILGHALEKNGLKK